MMSSLQKLHELVDPLLQHKVFEDLKSLLFSRTSLVFSGTLFTAYILYRNSRHRYSVVPRWPPGPRSWPVIGSALSIKQTKEKRIMDNFQDLVQEYGPMVHLYLGMDVDVVIISGTDLIYEAFVKKGAVFSNRALHMPLLKDIKNQGIVLQQGATWRKIRSFTTRTLKELGLGRASLPKSIQDEALQIVKVFQESKGSPFEVSHTLNNGVSNVICSLVFNQRFDHDNEVIKGVLTAIDDFFTYGGAAQFARSFLPKIVIKLFSNSQYKFEEAEHFMRSFIEGMIEKHRKDFDPNEMRDFTDYYLKTELSNDPDKISEKNMFKLIMDLFLAGTETTSTTLNWMVLYLTRYQDVQQKCRKEIHRVIGTSRQPSWKDKGSLPYTEAMLLETQRLANIAPLSLPHCTSEPVELGGYLLPEKTVIIPNFTESMTSERYWKDANTFNPQRWLDQDGQLKTEIPKSFIPFGIGPRTCPGDTLAKMELFIFSTSILQQLKLSPEDPDDLPSLRGNHLSTITPCPYRTLITNC